MAADSRGRRALAAQAHHLKARVTISADTLTDGVVEHVRRAFGKNALLKVRIRADSGEECDAAAAWLAERVPCEIISRIGRVAVLYRPPESQ